MDAKEVKVIVNQKRQTNWLTDYHANYKKKLEEHRNAVISEAEKEKKGVKRKNRKGRVSCTAKKVALAIFV